MSSVPQDLKIAVGLCGTLVVSVALLSPVPEAGVKASVISLANVDGAKASEQPFAYASSSNPLVNTNGDSTAFASALKNAGCYSQMYPRDGHTGWSSGSPTEDEAKCDKILEEYVGNIGVSTMMEWIDKQADQGSMCTHMKSIFPTDYYAYECELQEGLSGDRWMEGEQYQNWAHRLGAFASTRARELGTQKYGVEAVAANVGWHHGIHGAVWEPIVNAKDSSKAWSMHTENANWVKYKDIHMYIDACHGVGHAITYYTPSGTMPSDKQLSMKEAVELCAAQPYDDYRCQACCNDGIFHESTVASLHDYWAEKAVATLPSELDPLDEGLKNKLKSCADVGTLMPFFCYRWSPVASIATQLNTDPEGACKIITGTSKMAIQAIPGDDLVQLGGCLAGQFGTSVPFDTKTTMVSLADEYCGGLEEKSYALWLACSYGGMNAEAHLVFDTGSYAPVFRPKLMSSFVSPRCNFPDELAKVLCEVEVMDGFAGASLTSNSTFLSAVNKPQSKMYSDASFKAAHTWALSHFTRYNSSLKSKPSSMLTPNP